MAAAFARRLGGDRVTVLTGGSEPADALHPAVAEAMREEGLDLAGERPRRLAAADVHAADVVVTMGCGDACPVLPGKRYEDWRVADPAGMGIDGVRGVRDDLRARVADLLLSLGVEPEQGDGATSPCPRP
jgi:protein-tyrosine-phosphatase